MKRAIGALIVLGLIGGAVWIGLGMGRPQPDPESRLVDAAEPGLRARDQDAGMVPRCSEDIPFEPTYLPTGFRHERFEGPFPGGRPLDDPRSTGGKRHQIQVVVHYRGPDGSAVEIRRPGTLFVELAQGDDAPTIYVLGSPTTGFAPLGPRGNDFIVQFHYPPGAQPHQWCSLYSLNEHGGLSLAELKKVATDLRVRAKERPFTLLVHCGLSFPLRFRDGDWLPVDPRLRRTHNPPDGFGSDENYDRGTIREIDDDTVIYTSSEGVEVEYEPTDREAGGCA